MLIIKLIGVAMVVGLAVRWKRMRLPLLLLLLLLLLLGLLLQRMSCSHEASIKSDSPGCSDPATCIEPGAPLGDGPGESHDGTLHKPYLCPAGEDCGPKSPASADAGQD